MDKGKSRAQMEKFQKDRDPPAHGASEESEEASGAEELDLERQEIIGDDGSETPVHDPTDLLVPDIDSGDQAVQEYLGNPGNLEEPNLVCDEKIAYDSEFPENDLADQVTNLQKNDEEKSTDERSEKRSETGLKEVTNDEEAEGSTQVAEDPVVIDSQNESLGQGDSEDLLEVLEGDIVDQRTRDEISTDIMRMKLDMNKPSIPPW